jgi:hypothetical protein
MPAKPRPRLAERRADAVRRPRLGVGLRERVREVLDRDLAARDEPEVDRFRLDRLADPLELDRFDLVSPFSRRILFTVRAATSSARLPYRPDFFAACLMS